MLTAADVSVLSEREQDVVALVRRPLERFVEWAGKPATTGHDDLDAYEGLAFGVAGRPVGVIRYAGQPSDEVSILVASELAPTEQARLLSTFTLQAGISGEEVTWRKAGLQRKPVHRWFGKIRDAATKGSPTRRSA